MLFRTHTPEKLDYPNRKADMRDVRVTLMFSLSSPAFGFLIETKEKKNNKQILL